MSSNKNQNKQKRSVDPTLIQFIVLMAILVLVGGGIAIAKAKPIKKAASNTASTPAPAPSSIKEDYHAPASIDPIDLPSDLEATIGFSPKQLQNLSEHYALAKYDIGQNSIVYYYQTALATNGERMLVICTKMSEDDFLASLPQRNTVTETYNGIELTYAERWLYSVPNDYEIPEDVQEGIDQGKMEVEYGNTLQELIDKECFYWYDNGVKYEIQMRNQNLPYEDLLGIAKKIIDAK